MKPPIAPDCLLSSIPVLVKNKNGDTFVAQLHHGNDHWYGFQLGKRIENYLVVKPDEFDSWTQLYQGEV